MSFYSDVMLPELDGFAVCRKIRETSTVPIVMLTARGDDTDRIVGLELGADDYVPKPYNPRELLARMKAVVRRARPGAIAERIEVGELIVDVPAHRVSLGEKDVELTSFEFRVLVALARRAGETVAREELAGAVKGGAYDPSVDRSLDVHVSHLRQKLEDDPRDPRRIPHGARRRLHAGEASWVTLNTARPSVGAGRFELALLLWFLAAIVVAAFTSIGDHFR